MATGDNPTIPLYEDGERISAAITAAVSSGRFCKATSGSQGGLTLDTTTPMTGGNLFQVAQCVAGDRAWGVSAYDGASVGDVIGLICGHDIVVPMIAGGTIAANDEVQSDANGKPITLGAGKANGLALNAATAGQTVYVRIY